MMRQSWVPYYEIPSAEHVAKHFFFCDVSEVEMCPKCDGEGHFEYVVTGRPTDTEPTIDFVPCDWCHGVGWVVRGE